MKNQSAIKGLDTEILVMQGGAIKALGRSEDGKIGRVGGVLCRFTSADSTDGYGDFFDDATDFRFVEGMTCPVYFDHALAELIGVKVFGTGILTRTELGIEIQAELELADPDAIAIYEKVERGELGWSSGTAGHLVKRTQVRSYEVHGNDAWHIDHWPLGLDASLTPHPAERRNVAYVKSLKSLRDARELPDATVTTVVEAQPNPAREAQLLEIRQAAKMLRVELLKA